MKYRNDACLIVCDYMSSPYMFYRDLFKKHIRIVKGEGVYIYDEYGKKEWERWDVSPVERVKFEVHLYYLRKHLGANDRILEIEK